MKSRSAVSSKAYAQLANAALTSAVDPAAMQLSHHQWDLSTTSASCHLWTSHSLSLAALYSCTIRYAEHSQVGSIPSGSSVCQSLRCA